MKDLRIFETESEYINEKESFEYPQVSLTKDNSKVWVENYESYLIATYNVKNTSQVCYFFGDEFNSHQIDKMYIDNEEVSITQGYMFDTEGLHTVKCTFKKGVLTDCSNLFYYAYNLVSVDVSHLDTSNVVSMNSMFTTHNWWNNGTLETIIGLEDLDTSNVIDMGGMFAFTDGLTSIDLSKWNTSKVQYMDGMFYQYTSTPTITSIIFGDKFDTSNVTTMDSMFNGNFILKDLDLSSFDTSNVTNMYSMFAYCSCWNETANFDVNHFDTSNVTDMTGMFESCRSLTSLDLSNWNTSNVTNVCWMFHGCSGLTSLDLSNFDTSNVTDMTYTFNKCSNIKSIKFGKYGDVTNVVSYKNTFADISSNCELVLCENTRTSWETLLNNMSVKPTNITYNVCE